MKKIWKKECEGIAERKIGVNFALFLIANKLFYYFNLYTKMKKIALSLAVIATLAMVSCGNKKAENADSDTTDTTTVVAIESDTMVNDSETVATTEAAVAEEVTPADNKDAAKDNKAAKTEEPAKADSAKK